MADRNINEQYVTKAQFSHWRHFAIVGYAILAVGCAAGIWAVTEKADSNIRSDISLVSERTCEEIIIPAINNFNSLLTEVSITAGQLNNDNAVERYKSLYLNVPTLKECKENLMVR